MITSDDIEKIFTSRSIELTEKKDYEKIYKELIKNEYNRIYNKGVTAGKREERRKKERGITITALAEELGIHRDSLYRDIASLGLGAAVRKRVLQAAVKKFAQEEE